MISVLFRNRQLGSESECAMWTFSAEDNVAIGFGIRVWVWVRWMKLSHNPEITKGASSHEFMNWRTLLTFCCASVSAFLRTFSAYTSPVYFSRTTCTSPKCPRPIMFFTSKSFGLIRKSFRSLIVEESETMNVHHEGPLTLSQNDISDQMPCG